MQFHLALVRTRKKLDKYFKINKIRNKYIIDVRKIMDDENINANDPESMAFFKVLVWNRIQAAEEKNKDIYYIPNFQNHQLQVSKLLQMKKIYQDKHNFNLLLFFEEFVGTNWLIDILAGLDTFDNSQIIKDY